MTYYGDEKVCRSPKLTVCLHSNDIARAGGSILDKCSRGDNMVQGWEAAYGNGNIAVTILAKKC